jgi:hypothetical protein
MSAGIWRQIAKQARTAATRKVAISYVTTDHIGLRSGDVLVCDASARAIRSGQTDVKLLRKLYEDGVRIHSHEGLNSKVILLGKHAIVGSANMSGSGLIEASVITDAPSIVSGIASFIAQLSTERSQLDEKAIATLCKINVVGTGWPRAKPKAKSVRRLGNSTWIVGVNEITRDPTEREQKHIDRANAELSERFGKQDDHNWIRWGKKSRFAKECREGDTIIQIWNRRGGKRPRITRRLGLLLKRHEPDRLRLYIDFRRSISDEVSWSRFQRILRAAGYSKRVGKFSVQRLDPEMAEAIDRHWTRVR